MTTKPQAQSAPAAFQEHTVTLYSNGEPVGSTTPDGTGTWSFAFTNLKEGSNIMTASSDGKQSNEWTVNVSASSGAEDWENLPFTTVPSESMFKTQHGLTVFYRKIEGNTGAGSILTIGGKKVFRISGGTVDILLPTDATVIEIEFDRTFTRTEMLRFFSFSQGLTPISDDDTQPNPVYRHTSSTPISHFQFSPRSYHDVTFDIKSIKWQK